jgi:ubiquinone/menaquinone biosynthesis C-methylase UbiE
MNGPSRSRVIASRRGIAMSQSSAFVGSIPQTYHRFLGPLLFEGYAQDITRRLRPREGERILELACGTGIVTRPIAQSLPPGAALTATDLNEAMLAVARTHVGPDPRVTYLQADACTLPFDDASFDAIVCQYGVMFFPDKLRAMREARRILTSAATSRYLFNVWDSLANNPIPRVVQETVADMFPANPPQFLGATPYGYSDRAEIERTARAAGFTTVKVEAVELPSGAPTADDAARAFVEGTPLLAALQERGVQDITPIRAAVAEALAARFGKAPCMATMRALVFAVS